MDRVKLVRDAYSKYGDENNVYDSIIMNSSFKASLYNYFIFGLNDKKIDKLIEKMFLSIKDNDRRKILDISLNTGVINLPIYKSIKTLKVVALDNGFSNIQVAKKRIKDMNIKNVELIQGNENNIPFDDETYSCVISIFGFNNFNNKPKAYKEILRVLKPGGTFIGAFYIKDENKFRDFFRIFANKKYLRKYYYSTTTVVEKYTKDYEIEEIGSIGSIIYFTMKKKEK